MTTFPIGGFFRADAWHLFKDIGQRFDAACRRLGINAEERSAETDRRWHLVTTRFRRPARKGDQLTLL